MSKNKNIKLSVVIPCYNAADTIGEQLEALSNQKKWNHSWEVVVVDNDSTDRSMQKVAGFKDRIKNLSTVEANEKKGVAYARNQGVKHSEGEYIAFCDADDVVADNWVAVMGNALFEHSFVACKINRSRLGNYSETTLKTKVQADALVDFSLGKFLQHGGGGTLGIKKCIHDQVGGINEAFTYLEAVDYCWSIQLEGYELKFIPEAVIYVRARNTHFKRFKQEINWAEYDIYLLKKYDSYEGMPEFSIYKTFRSLYHALRASRWLFSEEKRGIWIVRMALQLGRIKGFIKYKLYKYGLIDAGLGKIMTTG